jgi:hypothetical protein
MNKERKKNNIEAMFIYRDEVCNGKKVSHIVYKLAIKYRKSERTIWRWISKKIDTDTEMSVDFA